MIFFQKRMKYYKLQIIFQEAIHIILKKSYYSNWVEIDILVKKFIDNFNKKIDVDISKDKLLLEGLLNHIKPTIYRLQNKIKLENSICRGIKQLS